MTVPLAVNSAAAVPLFEAASAIEAPSVTVSVEPFASAIWLATVRFQMSS